MFGKLIFKRLTQKFNERTSEFLRQATAPSTIQATFWATRVHVAQVVFGKAMEFTTKIPVPAGIKKHLSKKDVALIAAAYAIPLPGTALFAAVIVAGMHGFGHMRNRLKPQLALDAGNG